MIRANGNTFEPAVFDLQQDYHVWVGHPDSGEAQMLEDLRPMEKPGRTLNVAF